MLAACCFLKPRLSYAPTVPLEGYFQCRESRSSGKRESLVWRKGSQGDVLSLKQDVEYRPFGVLVFVGLEVKHLCSNGTVNSSAECLTKSQILHLLFSQGKTGLFRIQRARAEIKGIVEHLSNTFWHVAVGSPAFCEKGRFPLKVETKFLLNGL